VKYNIAVLYLQNSCNRYSWYSITATIAMFIYLFIYFFNAIHAHPHNVTHSLYMYIILYYCEWLEVKDETDAQYCVQCFTESVRLVNGGKQWGTVSGYGFRGSGWDVLDAAVVCKELGCGAALSASGGAHFGKGSGPVVTYNVRCRGNESALRYCSSGTWGRCFFSFGRCLRLVNGGSPCAGRVEVYHDGQWGTVDGFGSGDSGWDMADAAVVCKELGCGATSRDAHFGEGSGLVVTWGVRCRGSESTLRGCQSQPWRGGHTPMMPASSVQVNISVFDHFSFLMFSINYGSRNTAESGCIERPEGRAESGVEHRCGEYSGKSTRKVRTLVE
uniref:SRCR domain-containing protein n=1 Tax=Callorhinchus milii TaxID=7868 RepID=A0A4W3HGX5_CALMI